MAPRHLDIRNQIQTRSDPQIKAFETVRRRGHNRKNIADLAAVVEKALKMADASGFDFVGIDLCSALERLKQMDEPRYLVDPRDCE